MTIEGVSKSFASPVVISRTSSYSVKASVVKVNCSSNQTSEDNFIRHWGLYEIDVVTLAWHSINTTFSTANLTNTSQTLIIPTEYLQYGMKVLTLFLTRKDPYGVSSTAYGFFSVAASELKVLLEIIGEDIIYEENPRTIDFDGLKSYDPDEPENNNGLKYVWFCLRSSEFLDISLDYEKVPITGPLITNSNKTSGGCFGEGPGRLNNSLPRISLDSSLFDVDNSYKIILMVSKDKRMALAPSNFTIVSRMQANYSIT